MVAHQVLWDVAWQGDPPELGGALAALSPAVRQGVMRGFAAPSSLVTVTVVGALCGLIARAAGRSLPRAAPAA
ncbi:hypothetical protein [Nocardiopsis sp. MG754419]|uniref:hypothetical protein n=1 Tax=Nocardiopsis sp. MG754419 TaxID=2259865 RepID=UPI0027DC0EA6|nr:hypothetical protein [Nocardiopsis sp. MG754419]